MRIQAAVTYEKSIREALRRFPPWILSAARVSSISVAGGEYMRQVLALYEHGSRSIKVYPGLSRDLLVRAIGHEIMHAVDDNFDHPHVFSYQPGWLQLHRDRGYFEIPKYRDEPLEFFADIASKYFLLGRDRLQITYPEEVYYLETSVFPILRENF